MKSLEEVRQFAAQQGISVRGTTKVTGIFGDPVVYSLSPKMHNHAFAKLNLDFVYVPFLVKKEDLKKAVESIRGLNLAGVNVTIPHKETIIPLLDSLSPLARTIGAVNTVLNNRGKLVGYNTDAPGFLSSLREEGKFNPKGKSAVLWGAGGVAHAMGVALLEAGIKKILVLNRTYARGKDLAKRLKKLAKTAEVSALEVSSSAVLKELRECDLFLNATPSGIDAGSFPAAPEKFLSPGVLVFDAVYSKVTPLILAAKRNDAPYLNGLGMLARQGALSFSLWTGAEPPFDLMREALEEAK